jgi:hypothetical protein
MSTELAEVEPTELEAEAGSMLAQARTMAITTPDDAANAAAFLKELKAVKLKITETFGPLKKAASDAHKKVVAVEAQHLEPVEKADRLVRDKVGAWNAEQERIREQQLREAQEKAEAEARAQREAEAKALQEQAAAAKRAGDAEQAAELRTTAKEIKAAPLVVAVEAPAPVAKLDGVSTRYTYDFEVTNPALLPREYLTPDLKAIKGVVSSLKDKTNIPGVKVIRRSSVTVR